MIARGAYHWLVLCSSLTAIMPASALELPAAAAKSSETAAAAVPALTHRPANADRDRYGQLPLRFEVNRGQTDGQVRFLSRGPGYALFLAPNEAVLSLPTAAPMKNATLRMRLAGAANDPAMQGLDELPTVSNYFVGNDAKAWRSRIPNYARVACREVYPGIDLVYHGAQRQLEYDFFVAPGADPKRIVLDFEGARAIDIDEQGDLVLSSAGGDIVQPKPLVYQYLGDEKKIIAAGYRKVGKSRVMFSVATYDKSRPLIIDPVLSYSTFLGGNGDDLGLDVAVDGAGNAYITGETQSIDFPLAVPRQPASGGKRDVFVAKLNAAGDALIYATYLGGDQDDSGSGIAVDGAGNAYITGNTASANFPTANALQPALAGFVNAFAVKLSAAGDALMYATYVGGSGTDSGLAIAVDGSGAVYLTGTTNSADFPAVNALRAANGGSFDAFATKINAAGSAYVFSTYLGGSGLDQGMGIAVDGAGNAYLAGTTGSSDFPVAHALQPAMGGGLSDAFVAKLNAAGSALIYSTYLGGSGADEGIDIALDSTGNAYITGRTESANFPTAPTGSSGGVLQDALRGGDDAFVSKIDPLGGALIYSTFLGGSATDRGLSIAVDNGGRAYIAGSTDSSDFPTANPLQHASGGGRGDAFLSKLDAVGHALAFSTYLGGSGSGQGSGFTLAFENATGVAVDSAGNAYLAGITNSSDFPTAAAIQPSFGGGLADAYLARIAASASTTTALSSSGNPSAAGQSVIFTATVSGAAPVTGAVVFKDGATTLGTANLDASFRATLGTSSLGAGNHAITAQYQGNAGNDVSASSVLAQTVAASDAGSGQPPPAGSTVGDTSQAGNGGGGCAIATDTAFDPTLLLVLAALGGLHRRLRRIKMIPRPVRRVMRLGKRLSRPGAQRKARC